jgi:hypothetical protein
MKKIFGIFTLIAMLSIVSFADIAQPKPTNAKPTPKPRQTPLPLTIESQMDIRIDPEASEPTLIITKGALSQLRAELENSEENSLDALALNTENTESEAKPPANVSKIPTIMSGIFLSMALIFGGVWLARARNLQATKTGKVALGLMIFALFGAGASVVLANMAPPFARGFSANIFTEDVKRFNRVTDNVKIKVVKGDYNNVTLVVPEVKGGKPKAE